MSATRFTISRKSASSTLSWECFSVNILYRAMPPRTALCVRDGFEALVMVCNKGSVTEVTHEGVKTFCLVGFSRVLLCK